MAAKHFFFVVGALASLSYVHACTMRKPSCRDLKTRNGFEWRFITRGPVVEMEATQSGKTIAFYELGKFQLSPEVVRMDLESITTRTCCDLEVKFIFEHEGERISDSCETINVIKDTTTGVGPAALIVLMLGATVGYIPWKKKREKKHRRVSALLYLQDILKCFFIRKRNSAARAQEENLDSVQEDRERGLLQNNSDGTEADAQNTDDGNDSGGDQMNDYLRVSVVSGGRVHKEIWGKTSAEDRPAQTPKAMDVDGLLVHKVQFVRKTTNHHRLKN